MPHFLDMNAVFFSVMGYDMSYVEFFGTLFNLLCVWLTVKNKVLSWPVGLVGTVLFFILFYQIRLYSDMFEQVYFFVTGFWGWWLWTHPKRAEDADAKKELKIVHATRKELIISLAVTVAGTLALGALIARIHLLLPSFFTVPADYPYTDAFTTVMSFVATVLMMRKRVECWHYWILVDIIGIWLYYVKGVRFISLEYAIFLIMATSGLLSWRRLLRRSPAYGLQNKPGRREVLPAA